LKSRSKYYKGLLRCEFQTTNPKKIGNSTVYTKQSTIQLEPRFRFGEVEEISEEEYVAATKNSDIPYIRHVDKSDVEFTFKNAIDPLKNSELKKVDEIILILKKSDSVYDDGEKYIDSNLIGNFIEEEHDPEKQIFYSVDNKNENLDSGIVHPENTKYYSPFNSYNGKASHGKIKGIGYTKQTELIDENDVPLSITKINEIEQEKINTTIGTSIPGPIAKKGCFGKSFDSRIADVTVFGRSRINAFNQLAGLQPGGRGCFSGSGSGRSGCMIPLFLLLLGLLLWALMNMRSCQQNATPPPVIIHDTIKVEVQKIDTLTIVKTDTVSYIDSTTKLNYETVNLPNVQFITNSEVLLPSSASDLQKLAEYLIKNDSLKATIFGHTDNVGKPEENLKLSQRRAESVKKFLSSLGVDASRLTAVGKGDTEPKADNNLEEGRLMNRRVEVQLTNTEFVTTSRTKKEDGKDSQKENKPKEKE
jgi:outer membrane protein OmpA-like peptidoglycan-associated protein